MTLGQPFVRFAVNPLRKGFLQEITRTCRVLGITVLALGAGGCAVKRTTRVRPSQVPVVALDASTTDLVTHLNTRSEAIRTLTAKVDLAPTAGSIYSGVIKEYHDVKGFILIEKPAMIRMIGQAPVVRTSIFDMVSNGEGFSLYIPSKQKFYVGKNESRRPAKNSLENMRPQHILDALLLPPIDAGRDKYLGEEAEEGGHRYYVLTVLEGDGESELALKRKVWFDRSDLEISRQQMYGPHGRYIEDVQYSNYQDFHEIRYPTRIQVTRPVEDYRLSITIEEATFNQPIAPDKFELKKPEAAQLVDLTAALSPEDPRGQ